MATSFRQGRWALVLAIAAAIGLGALVSSRVDAQQPKAQAKAKTKAAPPKGKAGRPVQRKAPPNAADPLGKPAEQAKDAEPGTFHFQLEIRSIDGNNLAVSYYPATKQDTTAPIALLIHENERSRKDFEDPIPDLENVGLAPKLQATGYAVLALDLRGHGENARRALTERDWKEMVDDLQSAYMFLVDRHNRGEINLAKLGVVALAEGANLAAAWAYQPGAAVSSEGRVTDLSGLALVSPLAEGEGYGFPTLMNALSTRIPVLLMVGERDASSHDTVKRVRANVERTRQNKVELFPSSLHGYKLLRLEPRAASALTRFLDSTVKLRSTEWEPRYNLNPVSYANIKVIRHKKVEEKKADEKKAEEKKAEEKKADEAPKVDEKKAEEPAKAKDRADAKKKS